MGYSIASVLQLIMLTYTYFLFANILSFGCGCYIFGKTVTKEVKGVLYILDERLRSKTERSLAMKRFTQLIEWHSFIKQLSKLKFNRIKIKCFISALFPTHSQITQ